MGLISRTGWGEGGRKGGLITISTVNGTHIARVDRSSSDQERVSVRPLHRRLIIIHMFAFHHLHDPPTSFTATVRTQTSSELLSCATPDDVDGRDPSLAQILPGPKGEQTC
jgi:hypothetical protein